jgi:hypothetical protein
LGLHNGPLSITDQIIGLYWQTAANNVTTRGMQDHYPYGDGFDRNTFEHAFVIRDTPISDIPEPASLGLAGAALAIIALRRHVATRSL